MRPNPPAELRRVIQFMGTRQTTSVGSTTIGARLLDLGKRRGGSAVLRHPRHVNAREFQTDNFILLGSRLSIPWVELFEPSLNFPMRIDPQARRFYLENRSPRAGERPRHEKSDNETFVDVALLPNTNGTGTVLIFNSIDMLGVEAAGDFAMGGSLATSLRNRKEILLRVRSIGGTATKLDIIAVRT